MSFEVEWTQQSALNPGGKRGGRLESGEGKKESIGMSYTPVEGRGEAVGCCAAVCLFLI